MSCAYPSCMMGGGSCPYETDCEKESQARCDMQATKRLLDLEEQRLRIALMKRKLSEDMHD